jgi:uncharacterized protein
MKKEIKLALLIFIGFLAFLWLEKPLKELLLSFQVDALTAKFSSGTVVRVLLIFGAYQIIKRLHFKLFTGLSSPALYSNIQATFIPLVFVLMGIFSNWNTYYQAELPALVLFALSVLAVGFVEEFVFRGTLFPLCIQAFKNTKNPILYAAALSGSAFGMVHFVNLFSQPENLAGITSQVFFALSIGIFFSGLMVRTENILIPAFIHTLINFGFGAGELNPLAEALSSEKEGEGVNWNSVIPTTLFFAFILVGGVFMIMKSNTSQVLQKLETE